MIFGEEDIKDYNTKLELNKYKNFFAQIENNAKQTPYKKEKFSENDKKIINEKINNFKNLLFNKNNTNLEKKKSEQNKMVNNSETPFTPYNYNNIKEEISDENILIMIDVVQNIDLL